MIKIYLMVIVLGIVASVGYGAVWYYNDTQERIATLQENNAKLEVAIQTSEASLESLQQDMAKFAELNNQLQNQLQKAEEYGDELQAKLRRHNLTALAIKKPGLLEGKMNDATAKLWRDLEQDTGGLGDNPLPHWLQPSKPPAGTEGPSSDQGRENIGSDSQPTETNPVN